MTLTLPEDPAALIRVRVEQGGYDNPEDYVAALVATDSAEAPGSLGLTGGDRRRLGDLALEALDSGRPGVFADAVFWDDLRRRGRDRAAVRMADVS